MIESCLEFYINIISKTQLLNGIQEFASLSRSIIAVFIFNEEKHNGHMQDLLVGQDLLLEEEWVK